MQKHKKSKLNKNNNPCMVSDRSISAQKPKLKQNFLHLILLYGDIRTKKQQKKINDYFYYCFRIIKITE